MVCLAHEKINLILTTKIITYNYTTTLYNKNFTFYKHHLVLDECLVSPSKLEGSSKHSWVVHIGQEHSMYPPNII